MEAIRGYMVAHSGCEVVWDIGQNGWIMNGGFP